MMNQDRIEVKRVLIRLTRKIIESTPTSLESQLVEDAYFTIDRLLSSDRVTALEIESLFNYLTTFEKLIKRKEGSP